MRTHRFLNPILCIAAVAVCVLCLVIPAGSVNKLLASESQRYSETEKEESSEKGDSTEREFSGPRLREAHLVDCGSTPRHQSSDYKSTPRPALGRTATQHSDLDLRNGIGSPLLT